MRPSSVSPSTDLTAEILKVSTHPTGGYSAKVRLKSQGLKADGVAVAKDVFKAVALAGADATEKLQRKLGRG